MANSRPTAGSVLPIPAVTLGALPVPAGLLQPTNNAAMGSDTSHVGRINNFMPAPLAKTGGTFDSGQFTLIEPYEMAVAAGVDHHGAWPIMGMNVHAPMAHRAMDVSLQLFGIERGGHALGSQVPRPTLAHDGGEIVAFDEKTTAFLAVIDRFVFHNSQEQFEVAYRAMQGH